MTGSRLVPGAREAGAHSLRAQCGPSLADHRRDPAELGLAVAGACDPGGDAPHLPAHRGQHPLHGGRSVGSGFGLLLDSTPKRRQAFLMPPQTVDDDAVHFGKLLRSKSIDPSLDLAPHGAVVPGGSVVSWGKDAVRFLVQDYPAVGEGVARGFEYGGVLPDRHRRERPVSRRFWGRR